jgi:hypothetical protein
MFPITLRKPLIALVPIFAALACGTTHVTRIAEPIGPAPSSASLYDDGRLVVYTDVRNDARVVDEGYGASMQPKREPYDVFNQRGDLLQTEAGPGIDSQPQPMTLPAGIYLIRSKMHDVGAIEAQVRILPGRTTEVFLDRSWTMAGPTARGTHLGNALVRGPDGTIIGWRATAIGGGPRERR